MSASLDVIFATKANTCPDKKTLTLWASSALNALNIKGKIAIRVVDEQEMSQMNGQYRNKPQPTNILSFPNNMPAPVKRQWIGDLIICAPVLEKEALVAKKDLTAHWAHIVIHGVLHLLGHDHETDTQACEMESLEITILDKLGYPDPYKVTHL